MGNFINPFDFKTIYVNYFLGSQSLFPYLFIIILSFVCATMNMSNKIFLILLAIGSIMFGAYLGEAMYVFILFIIGFIIFYSFSKIIK